MSKYDFSIKIQELRRLSLISKTTCNPNARKVVTGRSWAPEAHLAHLPSFRPIRCPVSKNKVDGS